MIKVNPTTMAAWELIEELEGQCHLRRVGSSDTVFVSRAAFDGDWLSVIGASGHKDRMDLLDMGALRAASRCMGFGAMKYGEHAWRGLTSEEYRGALLRHLEADTREERDEESGEPHYAAVLANAMIYCALRMVRQ